MNWFTSLFELLKRLPGLIDLFEKGINTFIDLAKGIAQRADEAKKAQDLKDAIDHANKNKDSSGLPDTDPLQDIINGRPPGDANRVSDKTPKSG